jgi:hypothetical protein
MSELILYEGVARDTPGAGAITVYVKDNKIVYAKDDTGKEPRLSGVRNSKSINIEDPLNTEDISFHFTDVPITVTKLRAILTGSSTPSVTWTVRHGTDRDAAGSEVVTGGTVTTDITTGSDVIIFDDPSIVANSHLWIETTSINGTVDSIIITLFYDED